MDQPRRQNLTEIDENDFLYEEPSPYQSAMTIDELPPPPPSVIPSYQIDELMEDEDSDERDHVKELELTIANLTRHMPSEEILIDLSPSVPNKASLDDESNRDFPLEIESPLADQCTQQARSLSISIPTPINNHHRNSLSRSSGIKEHLTDLLSPTTSKSHSSLQRTSWTNGNKVNHHHHSINLRNMEMFESRTNMIRRLNFEIIFLDLIIRLTVRQQFD